MPVYHQRCGYNVLCNCWPVTGPLMPRRETTERGVYSQIRRPIMTFHYRRWHLLTNGRWTCTLSAAGVTNGRPRDTSLHPPSLYPRLDGTGRGANPPYTVLPRGHLYWHPWSRPPNLSRRPGSITMSGVTQVSNRQVCLWSRRWRKSISFPTIICKGWGVLGVFLH